MAVLTVGVSAGVAITSGLTITSDALRAIGATRGVTAWPAVLEPCTVSDTYALPAIATQPACGDPAPPPWTQAALAVLCAPDVRIDICVDDDTSVHRACLARRGDDHVLAVRSGETVELRTPRIVDVDDVSVVVASMFPPVEVPPFAGISVPAHELRERMHRCSCAGDYATSFAAVGASRADAAVLSEAFETCRVHTEVVATAFVDGVVARSSGTVDVYDTEHGRIVAAPSVSPDGRMWTTIAPGSADRMGHAVGRLIDTLPVPGWPAVSTVSPTRPTRRS